MKKKKLAGLSALTLSGLPWALRADLILRVLVAQRNFNPDDAPTQLAAQLTPPRAKVARGGRGAARTGGAVQVIPLCGILTPRGSFLSYYSGGSWDGLQGFRDEFADAVSNPDIGAIVLDIDSPGGYSDLVAETAEDIFEARGTKPIIAVANTQAASGAYWIGAQADEFVVTPSGYVGSVGVYREHEDWSRFEAQAGIDHTFIYAGKYKTEGNMFEPLGEDAQAAWQADVDYIYSKFVGAVAQGRGVDEAAVLADYGDGRQLLADHAVAAGMADRVAPIEDVIAELLSTGGSGGASINAGDRRKARLALVPTKAEADPPAAPDAPAAPADPADPADDPAPDAPAPVVDPDEPTTDPDDPDVDEAETEVENNITAAQRRELLDALI